MGLLNDKVIVVTGCSSGMGWESCLRFAREGAKVVAAGRRQERGQQLVAQIKEAGGAASFFATDISNESSVEDLFTFIEKTFGRLDGAFNNAGIETSDAALAQTTSEAFDRIFATNNRGTFLCMRRELQIMQRQGRGSIVNSAASAVLKAIALSSAYTASKHAIIGMSRTAVLEVAPKGIRINCICPGGIHTDMMSKWLEASYGGDDSLVKAMIPLGRIGEAREVAAAAAWLLSDEASYITGAVLPVDGGLAVA